MKRIRGDVGPALCVMAFAAVYLYLDMRLPEVRLSDPLGPKAFPALIGVGLLASALLLLLENRHKPRPSAVEADKREAAPATVSTTDATATATATANATDASNTTAAKPATRSRIPQPIVLIGMVVWTALYYTAFEPAGYLISTIVFLFGLLCYFNRGRLKTNVAIAIGVALLFDLLFSQLLGVPMPTGPLPF